MLLACRDKNYRLRVVSMAIAVLLVAAVASTHAGPISGIYQQSSETPLVIDSACDSISKGDFKDARWIIDNSNVSDSREIIKLRKIIDESIAIKDGLKAVQTQVYMMHTNEFERLRQNGIPEDAEDIEDIFSTVLKILKYADDGEKQALLEDEFLIATIEIAQVMADEFEAQGRWLDAYMVCYGKLKDIYQDDREYFDYGQMLLEKEQILTSLQNTPCKTPQGRYEGIDKQTFIKAVNFMDYRYIRTMDYRSMAIKAIDRCNLLAEVISNPYVETEYNIDTWQYHKWAEALDLILDRLDESSTGISKAEFTDIFEQTLMLNKSLETRIELPEAILVAQFSEGALSALDPYTAVYWPSQTKDFKKALTNQFSGIGIRFSTQEGMTKVVSVFPGTPAHTSDLRAGDIITAVNGIDVKDAPECAVSRITGPEDTPVTLTITRPDEDRTLDVTLNRARITIPSVYGWKDQDAAERQYLLDSAEKIGYIRISSFDSRTADDFEGALDQLESNGLKGLILDLRSNPGGLVSAAVEIADKFISEGLIVRTQPRSGMATYETANKEVTHAEYPIVVLINSTSASASEILAGVLQDKKYKRAVLVGERSYGKGTVQAITDHFGNDSQLKYTMAHYHLPSGKKVESRNMKEKSGRTDWGISPDVSVEMQTDELKTIADQQKENEFVLTIEQEEFADEMYPSFAREMIDTDSQLAIGLLVLKSKVIQFGGEL